MDGSEDRQASRAKHDHQWTPASVARYWNFYYSQPGAQELQFSYQMWPSLRRVIRPFLSGATLVADIGCGNGYLMEQLMQEGRRCSGIDFSQVAVDTIRDRFAGNPQFIDSRVMSSLEHLPGADGEFDAVFFLETIEHLFPDQIPVVIAELFRILRKGGQLILSTPADECLARNSVVCPFCGVVFHRIQHLSSFTAERMIKLAETSGFYTQFCRSVALFADWKSWIPRGRSIIRIECPECFEVFEPNSQHASFVGGFLSKLIGLSKPNLVYIGEKT